MHIRAATFLASLALTFCGSWAAALPTPVKTCDDVRAYMEPDGTMTKGNFKKVLIASGMVWDDRAEQGLNNQCKVTAYVKTVIMVQHVGPNILVSTHVVGENGVCRLTEISLSGC
ncbi:MAG: hypothetical protein KGJ78_18225 [Alphaproteobacteria bacterium]|nr:hypothetical protein [Alphaproteobacteria bacterium]